MAKWMLTAGAAALALTTPALAGPGHGGGGGGPKGDHGGGGGGPKGDRGGGGGGPKNDHGGGKDQRGGGEQMHFERGNGGGKHSERQSMRFERGNGGGKHAERQTKHFDHIKSGGKQAERAEARRDRNLSRGTGASDQGGFASRDGGRDFARADDFRGFGGSASNCPPGLARKGNGCLPPGQAKKMLGFALPAALGSSLLTGPYSQWYRDNDQYYYRDDGDYIYRVNRDGGLVDALFPYQDQAYSYYPVGSNYPADYDNYNVPYQYQSYYRDGDDYNYRYGDGAIYQVNRSNNTIDSIVALLAGDLGVGQRMPNDYGVYNVPMSFRDRYYDTPDAMYRYNDGYIYQADPKTQLITAVIDALV